MSAYIAIVFMMFVVFILSRGRCEVNWRSGVGKAAAGPTGRNTHLNCRAVFGVLWLVVRSKFTRTRK